MSRVMDQNELNPSLLAIRHEVLKQWKYHSEFRVSPDAIHFYQDTSLWADEMVYRLVARIWGKEESVDEHRFPRTWWDAFKQRWFPRWALKRWPVAWTVVTARRGIIYPQLSAHTGPGVRGDYLEIRYR